MWNYTTASSGTRLRPPISGFEFHLRYHNGGTQLYRIDQPAWLVPDIVATQNRFVCDIAASRKYRSLKQGALVTGEKEKSIMNLPDMAMLVLPSQVAPDRQFEAELLGLMPHLRSFSIRLCGNNLGEDIAQEALTRAWNARSSYQCGTKMKAWLFTIARNEFYSHQRHNWRQVTWNQDAAERIAEPSLQQQWASELSDVRRAMFSLPVQQRQALQLVAVRELSYEQAATIVGAPVGTIKSRLTRARAGLVKILDGTGPALQRTLSPGRLAG